MNKVNKKRSPLLIIIGLLLVIMAIPVVSYAAQATVNLGTTSTFAVLAGTTITNTGPTVINGSAGGDVGLFSGTDFPGESEATVSGAVHLADAVAGKAQEDLPEYPLNLVERP
jgi:hypothetical protein